jgi:hypothetical protein
MTKVWTPLYLDTEFRAVADGADFIAIALRSARGPKFLGVSNEFNLAAAQQHPFISKHVLPHLPPQSEWKSRVELASEIQEFVSEQSYRIKYWGRPEDLMIFDRLLLGDKVRNYPPNMHPQAQNLQQLWQELQELGAPQEILPQPDPLRQHGPAYDTEWLEEVDVALNRYIEENHPVLKAA